MKYWKICLLDGNLLESLNLLEAIENEDPSLFLPNTPLGEYAGKRREEFKTKSLKYLF